MSTFGKRCLLCFANVVMDNPSKDHQGELTLSPSMMTSDNKGGRQLLPLSLCRLVQNKALESSNPHQNIINRYQTGGNVCTLCHKCAHLAEDMTAAIFAPQRGELKAMVHIIRERILQSDCKVQADPEGVLDQDLLRLRQSLLSLSDESESISEGEVDVKVEIKEEEYDDHQELREQDPLLDVSSSSYSSCSDGDDQYVKQVEEVEEQHSHSSFIINPKTITSNTSVSQIKVRGDNQTSTPTTLSRRMKTKHANNPTSSIPPKRGPGRPRKPRKQTFSKNSSPISNPSSSFKPNSKRRKSDPLSTDQEDMAITSSTEPNVSPNPGHTDTSLLTIFPCTLCSEIFTDNSTLATHTWYHQLRSLNNCPNCDAKCQRRSDWEQHLISHQKNKPIFLCHVCFKPFSWRKDMMRHVRKTHRHEKTYCCLYCVSRFQQSQQLDDHIFTHHPKTRPFPCPYCPKQYAQNRYLIKHIHSLHTIHFV